MQRAQKERSVQALSRCVKQLQNFQAYKQEQAGIQKRQHLQVFKGQLFRHAAAGQENHPQTGNQIMQRGMVIGKKLIGVDFRKLPEFVYELYVAQVPGIHLVVSDTGINAEIVLPFIQPRQNAVGAVKQHAQADDQKHHPPLGDFSRRHSI